MILNNNSEDQRPKQFMIAKNSYDEYLRNHINNVIRSYNVIKSELPDWLRSKVQYLVYEHDKSKYSDIEYNGYLNHYYLHDQYNKELGDYNIAWNHHIHNNPHHWQYWLLYDETNFKVNTLDMYPEYVIEMLCDWNSFYYSKDNKGDTAYDWFMKNKQKMLLSDNTLRIIDSYIRYFKLS